jgi:hypothetical protein
MEQYPLTIYHRSMIMRLSISLIAALVIILPAHAQQASFSMFDFEQGENGIVLVVAMQPERAIEVIGGSGEYRSMLKEIREKTEMLAAYVESHVEITQGSDECSWIATPDIVGETLLDAQAEGITVRGFVECPKTQDPFTLRTDLFVESPGHQNYIRYREGDVFIAFATLDRNKQRTDVDLREIFSETIRETEGAVRDAKRVNTIIAAIIIAGIFGTTYWFRRKVSRRK